MTTAILCPMTAAAAETELCSAVRDALKFLRQCVDKGEGIKLAGHLAALSHYAEYHVDSLEEALARLSELKNAQPEC